MSPHCLWTVIHEETPFAQWWPRICENFQWPEQMQIERWDVNDVGWSKILDSAKNFSLFVKCKALIVENAAKAIKGEKDIGSIISSLSQSPHRVILVSDSEPPKGLQVKVWRAPLPAHAETFDDKIAFKWIDSIHRGQLAEAIKALETAFSQDQNAFALLQLVARDFRLGRLIHHAIQQRWRETEMASHLRVNPFLIKKWGSRKSLSRNQWKRVFDRLRNADLELKSGRDEVWALRKLTFDLIELSSGERKAFHTPSHKRAPTPPPLAPGFQSLSLVLSPVAEFA